MQTCRRAVSLLIQGTRRMSSQKLYELRTYEIRPSNVKKYMEESAKALPIRFQHSPCIGFFTSEVGSLNETIHLWEYDSYGQRAGIRVSLAGDPNWASTAAPMIAQIDKQDNASLRLLEWSTLKKDVEPTGVYFLYRFEALPSAQSDVSAMLETFVKNAGVSCLGMFREEFGKSALNYYGFFQSSSHDSAENPALVDEEHWKPLRHATSQIQSRLLQPCAWSNWK